MQDRHLPRRRQHRISGTIGNQDRCPTLVSVRVESREDPRYLSFTEQLVYSVGQEEETCTFRQITQHRVADGSERRSEQGLNLHGERHLWIHHVREIRWLKLSKI